MTRAIHSTSAHHKRKGVFLFQKYHQLYLMLAVPILYFIIFKYVPMAGNILAFRKYDAGGSIFGSKWVGLKYFELFITDPYFWNVFKNTLVLSVLNFLIGFPIPILFALLLNEVQNSWCKKFVQTVSYLPKFFSTVVVVGMMSVLLSPTNGLINQMLAKFGIASIYFMNSNEWFRPLYILSDLWQYVGWNSILYIAALTNVDPQLYEAAEIDGAGYLQKTFHVTIPGIMPTIVLTLILSVGSILSVGFEKVLLMYSPSTYQVADVIQTYVYRIGIVDNNYSYSTAVGLFQAVISLILIWGVNAMSKKFTDSSLW